MAEPRAKLSTLDVAKLQVETGCSARTITRWARGERTMRPATLMRLGRGAVKLGIPVKA